MVLLRCHVNPVVADCRVNPVVADCRDVLFLPRDYDIQFGADCRVVLLPREYVVDGRGGCVEVDLDSGLPIAIDLIVLPLKHGRAFAKVFTS